MKSGSVKLLSRRIIDRNARRFRNDTPDGKERHAAVWRTEIYSTLPNAPCGMIRAFPKRYSKQRRASCGGVENGNILDVSERSVPDDLFSVAAGFCAAASLSVRSGNAAAAGQSVKG